MIEIKKNKLTIILIVAILGVAGLISVYTSSLKSQSHSGKAIVTVDGTDVLEIDLGVNEIIDLSTVSGVTGKVEVKDGEVRLTEMDCSDKLCENYGWQKNNFDSAICLPNKLYLKIS